MTTAQVMLKELTEAVKAGKTRWVVVRINPTHPLSKGNSVMVALGSPSAIAVDGGYVIAMGVTTERLEEHVKACQTILKGVKS